MLYTNLALTSRYAGGLLGVSLKSVPALLERKRDLYESHIVDHRFCYIPHTNQIVRTSQLLVSESVPSSPPPPLQDSMFPIVSSDNVWLFLITEASSYNSEKSCYVFLRACVHDITSFLEDHPGRAGFDIRVRRERCRDNNAQRLNYGTIQAQVEPIREDDRSKDIVLLPAKGLLDLNKPLFGQVCRGKVTKDSHLEQIHRPHSHTRGCSEPLFGNAVEPLSKIVWWTVLVIHLPTIILTHVCSRPGYVIAGENGNSLGSLSSCPLISLQVRMASIISRPTSSRRVRLH